MSQWCYEAEPCSPTHLQVCWADGQQRSPGPGVAGAEGVLSRTAYHQHREERHGVHVAPRPQTCPRTGIESPFLPTSFSEGIGEQRCIKISYVLFLWFRTIQSVPTKTWHFYPNILTDKLELELERELTGNNRRAFMQHFLFLWSVFLLKTCPESLE